MMMTDNKFKKSARVKAMDYLARRDHSEKELYEKLKKNFDPTEITLAIEEIKERGWLIPEHDLSEKVTQSLHRKNKGIHYIHQFLTKKGLPLTSVDHEVELEKAMQLVNSRIKDPTNLSKVSSLLKNRGFDTETIGKVIYELRRSSQKLY